MKAIVRTDGSMELDGSPAELAEFANKMKSPNYNKIVEFDSSNPIRHNSELQAHYISVIGTDEKRTDRREIEDEYPSVKKFMEVLSRSPELRSMKYKKVLNAMGIDIPYDKQKDWGRVYKRFTAARSNLGLD